MVEGIKLSMTHHKRSGRYLIKTVEAPQGPALEFPSGGRIEELWREHAKGSIGLFMGNELTGADRAFYVDVGPGSTKAQRNSFLRALLEESSLAESE